MLDLEGFEVDAPVAEEPAAEAQVELPSLMEMVGGLDEVPADPEPVASNDAAPAVAPAATQEPATQEPAADDPWALPADNQLNADDDDLDAFLADLS